MSQHSELMDMKAKARLIKHFGSQTALARKLGVTDSTVSEWFSDKAPRPIPPLRAMQIEALSGGVFKAADLNSKCAVLIQAAASEKRSRIPAQQKAA